MIALAALCAAAAAALLHPPRRLRRPRIAQALPRARWLPALAAVPVFFWLHGRALALTLIGAAALSGVAWLARRSRSRTRADATRVLVVEACDAIAAELRAGRPPLPALSRGAEVWPDLVPVLAACRLDADVPDAFRRVADNPGAEGLSEVAASWQVAQRLGSGLAEVMTRVVDSSRVRLATHRVVATELASAEATARMVAILPVVLLVLSEGSGADPWHFLLATSPGLGCLAGGLTLAFAGMWWIDRIVTRIFEE